MGGVLNRRADLVSTCLTSVLVNAAEHSGAALGLLSSFCFLYVDSVQVRVALT